MYETSLQAREGALVWTGIEVLGRHHNERRGQGLDASQLQLLTAFLPLVPRSISVDVHPSYFDWRSFAAPLRSVSVVNNVFVPFFKCAYGFSPAAFVGRLQTLDLVHAFQTVKDPSGSRVDFASVGSLLPYATSLQELRVEITSQQDLIWLAYAVFHPKSTRSKWRTLKIHVSGEDRDTIAWNAWSKLFSARHRLSTMKNLLLGISANNSDPEVQPMEWTTATVITKMTAFGSRDRQTRLVRLNVGDYVEVCDPNGNEDGTNLVTVIVPGYGLAWVQRSHLSPVHREEYAARPRSNITSLTVDDPAISIEDQDQVLRLMGRSLVHLRTSGGNWFRQGNLCSLTPHLESINNVVYSPDTRNCGVQLLPKLKAAELCCTVETFAACADWLVRFGHFPAMRELCVRLEVDLNEGIQRFKDDIIAVSVAKHSLRRMTVLFALHTPFVMDRLTKFLKRTKTDEHVGAEKLAFLSIFRHVNVLSSISQLDTYLIRQVFNFVGPSIEHFHVYMTPVRNLDGLLSRNETEWRGDAWYDGR